MPTTVVKTIGSAGGRDYATLQAWNDGAPASLTGADEIWQGECYNDSEFFTNSSALLTVSGSTTDSTRYKHLTAAAGQSFQDNANVRTNALHYNQANGVGIKGSRGYLNPPVSVSENNFHISRVQLQTTNSSAAGISFSGVPTNFNAKDIVSECPLGGTGSGAPGTGVVLYNCLVICYGDASAVSRHDDLTATGCTFVMPSNLTSTHEAVSRVYGGASTVTLISCAIFGFNSILSGGGNAASKNNATDLSSGLPGSSNQHSVSYSSSTPFTQASNASTLNLSAIASTSLAANGFLDSTNAPNDITSTARAASPTIGVWEISGGGGGGTNWGPWVVGNNWNRLVQNVR